MNSADTSLLVSSYLSEESLAYLTKFPRRRASRFTTFHRDNTKFLRQTLFPGARILLIGFDAGVYLDDLTSHSVTVLELNPAAVPAPAVPGHRWITNLKELEQSESFDRVLMPYALQFLSDIQEFLNALMPHLHATGRIIFLQYNFLWAPILKIAQILHLRQSLPDLNWLNFDDLNNLLLISGCERVTQGRRCLLPIHIPGLSPLVNRWLAPLPGLRLFTLSSFVVCRRRPAETRSMEPTVSIVIPVRNEAGNIGPLLNRLPVLAPKTEVLFIEGHSSDSSWEEIQSQCQTHPRKDHFSLRALQQTGKGKADATRLGFSKATGDILMILDADLSVKPEDLPHFYNVLRNRYVDFVNGSRLIYKMESQAMQVLNLGFNRAFAWTISWLIGQSVKDSLCGTKALYRSDYEKLLAQSPTIFARDPFGDFSLLFGASQLLLRIGDVPVRYKRRTYGTTNIHRFRDGWKLLRFCQYFLSQCKF